MILSDDQLAILNLYKNAIPQEKIKIYARVISNFNQIKKHLDRYIPDSGTVLDYGCGYGIFSNYLKMKNPNLKIIGFDISTTRINEAKKSAISNEIEFTDKLQTFKFDNLKLVLLIDVLVFLKHDEKVSLLRKIYESLEDNGIVFIKDTLKSNSFRFRYTNFEEKIKIKLKVYGNIKPELNYITPSEFESILTETGFKIVEIIPENLFLYPGIFIIAQK